MVRRKRLRRRADRLRVLIGGRRAGEVRSAEEYEALLRSLDRSKHKVRLV